MSYLSSEQITITDPELLLRQKNTVHYLLRLEPERFLVEINRVAGIPTTTVGYGGWERSDEVNFRGHFFGHYLSALALAYRAEKDAQIKAALYAKLKTGIEGLRQAQLQYGETHPESKGYVSAFREVALDQVEGKKVTDRENVLVPWYNLHKILAGTILTYQVFSEDEIGQMALAIAADFGDYVYRRMKKLADPERMLAIEYGGMNEALYDLFLITKNPHHMIAATYFDELSLFKQLANHQDVLAGKHANTTIPKLLGALKRAEIINMGIDLGAGLDQAQMPATDLYIKAAENFWDIVISGHTYSNGGNSQSEHFRLAHHQYHDAEMLVGDCTCETCNSHNMLKLSRGLFALTKAPKYLEYYEKTLINAILASQNPETGMMMYFQPMGAGYNKVFSRPEDEFWCCMGTGIENFVKLSDTFYWQEEYLQLNLYFSHQVALPEGDLIVEIDRKHFRGSIRLTNAVGQKVNLALRKPTWLQQPFDLVVDGQAVTTREDQDYLYVDQFTEGTQLTFEWSPRFQIQSADDNDRYLSFLYGPYLLCGELGSVAMEEEQPNGILVRVGTKVEAVIPTLLVKDIVDFKQNIQTFIRPLETQDKLVRFHLELPEGSLTLSPYYQMYAQRYGIYFACLSPDHVQVKTEERADHFCFRHFDGNNAEYALKLKEDNTVAGTLEGRLYRQPLAEGFFQYQIPVPKGPVKLDITLHESDIQLPVKIQVYYKEIIASRTIFPEKNNAGFFKQSFLFEMPDTQVATISFASVQSIGPKIFGIEISPEG